MSTEVRGYRVEMEIPRVAREGTTWRTLAFKGSYSDVGDLADYLMGSLELAGVDREVARAWVTEHLRCVPETSVTTRSEPETMPTGP
jgi:hypothetical protein